MAYRITDACTTCGLCLDVCPIGAISEGDPAFVIDDTCCDFEECLVECPDDAIVPLDEAGGDGAMAVDD
jgi:ferredoxin